MCLTRMPWRLLSKSVVQKTGHIDISFCATSTHKPGGEQGAALTELRYEDFAMPLIDYTKATFNTAKAVYPYMVRQHSGVIMGMTAVVSQMPLPYTAGFGPAWAAVEAMLRLLAAELGPLWRADRLPALGWFGRRSRQDARPEQP